MLHNATIDTDNDGESNWSNKETAMVAHNITVTATYQNLEKRYHEELTKEFKAYEKIQTTEAAKDPSFYQRLIEETLWYRMMQDLERIQKTDGPEFSKQQCDLEGNGIAFQPIAGANCYSVGLCKTEIPNEVIPQDNINTEKSADDTSKSEEEKRHDYILSLINPKKEFGLNHLSKKDFFWKHAIQKLNTLDQFDQNHDFVRKILSWYLAATDQKNDVIALSSVDHRLKKFAYALHDCLRGDNIIDYKTDDGKEAHTTCPEGLRVAFCTKLLGQHPCNVFIDIPNFNEIAGRIMEEMLQQQYSKITDLNLKRIIKGYHDSPGDFPPGFQNHKRHPDRDRIDAFENEVMKNAILKIEQDYKLDLNDLMLYSANTLESELTYLKNACELIDLRGIAMMDIHDPEIAIETGFNNNSPITYDYQNKKESTIVETKISNLGLVYDNFL